MLSQSVGGLFVLLTVSFALQKLCNFMRSHLSILDLTAQAIAVLFRDFSFPLWPYLQGSSPLSPLCERPTRQQERCHNRILLHTFIGRALTAQAKDPEPRNGAAYIGLGVMCPYLIGYATSTSLICVGPGSDSAKNSYAHAHIGCLPIFMGVSLKKPAPSCNGVCGFPHQIFVCLTSQCSMIKKVVP